MAAKHERSPMADDLISSREWSVGGEALLRALFEAGDMIAGVLELLEDDYRYLAANPSCAAYYGLKPQEMLGRTGRDLEVADAEIATRLSTLRRCVEKGETIRREYPFAHRGRTGWFQGSFSPLPTPDGAQPRVAFTVIDISARKAAELAAEAERAKLRLALDAARLGLWEYDLAKDEVIWDARMRELFGVGADEAIDYSRYRACIHPEDTEQVGAAYQAALRGENGGDYTVTHRNRRPDGGVRWVRSSGRVLFDVSGRPARVLGTSQDVTEQVEAEERQNLLLAELNHRVKNNMATVQAIVDHTLRSTADDPAAFRQAFQERLFSLARGHDLLTRNAWETAELADVISAALAPFDPAAVALDGARGAFRVKPDLAVSLMMILHELATNAAKYGALSREGGRIGLAWRAEAGALRLDWVERGGPEVRPPARRGFGTRLTASALRPFGGSAETDFPTEGVRVRLELPLEGAVVVAGASAG